MKKLLLIFLAASISGCANNKIPKKNYENHPIIGVWELNLGNCIERYEYLPDGTRNVVSNQEIVKASYTVSEQLMESGFYKLVDQVIADNAKEDCSGSATDMTGDIVNSYIAFSANGNETVYCLEESLDNCFGPFKRK